VTGLLESLSAAVAHPSLSAIEQDIASLVGDEDTEARQMRAVAVAILAVLDSLSEVQNPPLAMINRLTTFEVCIFTHPPPRAVLIRFLRPGPAAQQRKPSQRMKIKEKTCTIHNIRAFLAL